MRHVSILLAALTSATAANAQDAPPSAPALEVSPPAYGGGEQELARQLSNPVASLISVPFQQNIDFGGGAEGGGAGGVKATLNIQPVVPISIAPKWNMIVRTILPVVYRADISASGAHEFGLGDTVQSFFFSPKETGPSGIIWGAGPVMLYPTATDRLLGSDKWGLGPSVVLLKQLGKATFGVLANHIWSVAGDSAGNDTSTSFIQLHHIDRDDLLDQHRNQLRLERQELAGAGKFQRGAADQDGEAPIQFGVAGRYYVVKPEGGSDWGIRLVLTLLFPK